jgi:hypothetical protein
VIYATFQSIRPHRHQSRPEFVGNIVAADTVCSMGRSPLRHVICSLQFLMCAGLLLATGCQQESGPRQHSAEQLKARQEEQLKLYPEPPPDTPEQIQQKEAMIEKTLPQIYAMLEEAKTNPKKASEVVELSMSLLTLLPGHREAKVAYCKARMSEFYANEGKDHYPALLAINSAVLEIDRLREDFDDLSEDELLLCQEVYFNQARREGYFPGNEDALDILTESMKKLMSSGFRDAERLKAEPLFQPLINDPKTAPIFQAAIEQIEASAEDVPTTNASEEEASTQPE